MATVPTNRVARAIQQGYLVVKAGQRSSLARYQAWCERNDQPYIVVIEHGKTAEIKMDLIFVPYEGEARSHLSDADIEEIFDVCEQAMGSYMPFCLPGTFTHIRRVPPENAETLAQALMAIFQQSRGMDVPLPVFAHPRPFGEVRMRLEEAKERGYCRAKASG
jgi:hypothetical protein